MNAPVVWQVIGSKAAVSAIVVILVIFATFAYFAIYCFWVLRKGYEYELSFRSLASAFLLGALSCLFLAWPLEGWMSDPGGFTDEVLGGAIEELAKFVAVLAVIS